MAKGDENYKLTKNIDMFLFYQLKIILEKHIQPLAEKAKLAFEFLVLIFGNSFLLNVCFSHILRIGKFCIEFYDRYHFLVTSFPYTKITLVFYSLLSGTWIFNNGKWSVNWTWHNWNKLSKNTLRTWVYVNVISHL